jgi:hypothetical protein
MEIILHDIFQDLPRLQNRVAISKYPSDEQLARTEQLCSLVCPEFSAYISERTNIETILRRYEEEELDIGEIISNLQLGQTLLIQTLQHAQKRINTLTLCLTRETVTHYVLKRMSIQGAENDQMSPQELTDLIWYVAAKRRGIVVVENGVVYM